MKVGDYARTIYGQITKIKYKWTELSTLRKTIEARVQCDDDELYDYPNEIKTSSKIKDLIEVGDYVNGEKITRIVPPDLCGDEELTDKKVYINDFEVYEEWIKSIVTHEQFSQMEYRIGE